MLNNTSINRSSLKAVGNSKGVLKFDENDLSPDVLKIWAIKCLLWVIKYSNIQCYPANPVQAGAVAPLSLIHI